MNIMHQYDCTICQIAIHNDIIICCCIHQLPVFCIKRPHEERLLYCIIDILIGCSIRCPGYRCCLSAGLYKCIVCLLEFCDNIINRHIC